MKIKELIALLVQQEPEAEVDVEVLGDVEFMSGITNDTYVGEARSVRVASDGTVIISQEL